MQLHGFFVLLLVVLMAVTLEAGKPKKEKGKKGTSACEDWTWQRCLPTTGDCGIGSRSGTCKEETKKMKCNVPCNWKKEFGADCKYKFGGWDKCDQTTGLKSRSGTLKKDPYNVQCLKTISVTKPCNTKEKTKGKKSRH
ncbi:midkine isoform X2 [Protopterus annectens]|nr:midkine isoform X2 [Protopterus annectens]